MAMDEAKRRYVERKSTRELWHGQSVILKLRFLLNTLKVIKLSDSSFDSHGYLAKYKI